MRRSTLSGLLVAGLLVGTPQPGWSRLAGGDPGEYGPAYAAGKPVTVTLLTGDRVRLPAGGTASPTVLPAQGRERIHFTGFRAGGHLYLVPEDAIRPVQSGRLDRRLFDVTELVESGYDDAHRPDLPLIIGFGSERARTEAAPRLAASGARVTRGLPAVRGSAVSAAKHAIGDLWASLNTGGGQSIAGAGKVERVWLDGLRRPTLDQSVPQIGAPTAWAAGRTGAGVSVAVLDTGLDATHPDLAGQVLKQANFTSEPDTDDLVGHGTHVASTIAGTGAASGGRYRGVAPGARLLIGKVCERRGCPESAVLAGMQWAADNGARVVNLSLGGDDTPEVDPLEQAVNDLTARQGTLFVVAAGNSGADAETINSPGSADAALTVGAVTKSDVLADFSSRGPRIGDAALKPDLTAPGVDIVAARAANGTEGTPVDASYTRMSGTSMATPHVAGAAAILAEQRPQWHAGELKAALMASAKRNPGLGAYQQGAGRVDVARALTQPVTTDPVSLSFGAQQWPHQDDVPVTRTLTYRNDGDAPLSLALSVEAIGPDGKPAPPGTFTLGTTSIVVPAGGQAQVSVTADTRVPTADGTFSGSVVATGPGVTSSTPIGVLKDIERYDLTLRHTDRTGAATDNYLTNISNVDGKFTYLFPYDADGTVTVRLPKATYSVTTTIGTPTADGPNELAMLSQPLVSLTRDTTIDLDARLAKPVEVAVPDDSARSMSALIAFYRKRPGDDDQAGYLTGESFDGLSTAGLGDPVPGELTSEATSVWAKPDANGDFTASPYSYLLTALTNDRLFTGLTRRYQPGELAAVHLDVAAPQPSSRASSSVFGMAPNGHVVVRGMPGLALPGRRVEYLSADGDLRWMRRMYVETPDAGSGDYALDSTLAGSPRRYLAGGVYHERWNTGRYGPVLPEPFYPQDGAHRIGSLIEVEVPPFSDSAGHGVYDETADYHSTLYRNEEQIGTQDGSPEVFYQLPDEQEARYRLVLEAVRRHAELTGRVTLDWTFRSGASPDGAMVPLPLMTVRYTPDLVGDRLVRDGGAVRLPLTVQHRTGIPLSTVDVPAVEVSYDGGRGWQRLRLLGRPDQWYVSVVPPAGATKVSLRTTASDTAGNSVRQTTIDAYRLS
ncbi:S8 family serine peptidase [Micromonospora sp. NPDC049559]|uniref:S8 family peptidase n=1 Tax=Micromonospora sp. NPDC049559 TaxID=3155923 RepID=UPI003415E7DA